MPEPKGLTRAQTLFLRAFHENPLGPPAERWPAAAVLRRWMRRPRFSLALRGVRDALRFQADLHLASAAAQAASALQQMLSRPGGARGGAGDGAGDGDDAGDAARVQACNAKIHALVQLLRLSHMRARFTADPPPPPPPKPRVGDAEREAIALLHNLRHVHPSLTVGRAIELIEFFVKEHASAGGVTEAERADAEAQARLPAWQRRERARQSAAEDGDS